MATAPTNSISVQAKPRTLAEIIQHKRDLLVHARSKREAGSKTYSSSKLMHMDAFIGELANTVEELSSIRDKMNKAWDKRAK